MMPWHNLRRFFYKSLRQPLYALGVGLRRFQANFYYIFRGGISSYPESITLFLTYRCNLSCKMCGQWGEGGITRKQSAQYIQGELSPEGMESLIDDIASFKPNITLFGGEPLLYPHYMETIKYIKQKKMHCLLITNGYLLENLAEDLVEAGLDELNVSLDGGARLHDQIRGMEGLFDKIMRGLKRVGYLKKKKGKKKPLINLQCTITRYNYEHLEQLIDVAKEAKADTLTFHNLIFLNQDILAKQREYDRQLNCSSSGWEGFIFDPGIDHEALYKKMQQILSGKYSFSIDFYPNFSQQALARYYNGSCCVPLEHSSRCLSPWVVAYIFPDGEVKPCLNFDYSLGNIKNSRFNALWNNDKAIRFRKLLKEKKIFPVCIRCTELYRY